MKKVALITAPILAVTCLVAAAHTKTPVGYPNFHDKFIVTLGANVPAGIKYQSQQGTIMPVGSASCSGQVCTFTITDNGTWTSSGTVNYLIGDTTQQGPYCQVSIADGAAYPSAILSTSCFNGAVPTALVPDHDNNTYRFQINKG